MRKDEVEIYLKIADFWSSQSKVRREIEWKVTFAVWALLAGSVALVLQKSASVPPFLFWFVPIGHAVWLRGVYVGYRHNANLMQFWSNRAHAAALGDPDPMESMPGWVNGREKWIGFLWNWSNLFQIGVTMALSGVAWWIA